VNKEQPFRQHHISNAQGGIGCRRPRSYRAHPVARGRRTDRRGGWWCWQARYSPSPEAGQGAAPFTQSCEVIQWFEQRRKSTSSGLLPSVKAAGRKCCRRSPQRLLRRGVLGQRRPKRPVPDRPRAALEQPAIPPQRPRKPGILHLQERTANEDRQQNSSWTD
jgi:hypothetical protein